MKLRYYLINRKNKTAFESFIKFCRRLYKTDYYKIIRYCIKKNGETINEKFGELFADEYLRRFDEARESAESRYKILIGAVIDDGFYLADMSMIGIYSLSNLIGLLKSNRNYIVEDEYGIRVTITELKRLEAIKKVHLHYKDTLSGNDRRKFTMAKGYLIDLRNTVEADYQAEVTSTSRASELLRLNNALNGALKLLNEGGFE